MPQEALRATRRNSIGNTNICNILTDIPTTSGTETNYIATNKNYVKMSGYFRDVDDIIIVFDNTKKVIQLHIELDRQENNLCLKLEIQQKINFMAIAITIEKGDLQFSVFRKPSKNKKVKCTLVQALRLCTGRTAQRGSRGITLLFLDHDTIRR